METYQIYDTLTGFLTANAIYTAGYFSCSGLPLEQPTKLELKMQIL